MMTKILLYGYCGGVFSSRRMQKKLVEDVGFSGVSGGEPTGFPDDLGFSQAASGGATGLFAEVLQIARRAGTMKPGRVVLDGRTAKANASKHKAMSYGRMQEDEKRLGLGLVLGLTFIAGLLACPLFQGPVWLRRSRVSRRGGNSSPLRSAP